MSRIVRNTSAVAAAFATNTVLSFLQIKLLTRFLSQSALGEYSATFAIGAIVSVLAAVGLPTVVLRYTAKYDALGAVHRIARLLLLAWGLILALAVVLIAVVAKLAPLILPRLYSLPPSAENVLLATAVFIATALRQVTYAGFDGLRRMTYPAALENLNVAVITAGILAFHDRLSVPLLLGMSLGSGLLTFVIATVLLVRVLRTMGGERREPSQAIGSGPLPPLLADITPFWWGAALNGVIGIGFGYADKLLVSLFLSFELVSIFFVAERVTFLFKRLLAVPLQVAAPEITRRWELGRREELRHDVGFLIKVQFAVAILLAALVLVAAEAAVLLVADSSFLAAAGLLRVLTISVVLMAAYAPITTLLRAIERIGLALASDVIWLGCYVGLGVVLMPKLGLHGIVLAHLAASTVTAVWNIGAGERAAHIAWDLRGLSRVLGTGLLVGVPGYALATIAAAADPLAEFAVACAVLIGYGLILPLGGALSGEDRLRCAQLAGRGRIGVMLDLALFWPARLRDARRAR